MLRKLLLAALSLIPAYLGSGLFARVEVMPITEVKPGMIGHWDTVVQGRELSSFPLEVVGISYNTLGPKRHIIWCRITHPEQQAIGGVGGMSGSPVYVNGKLMGAYAYSIPWPKGDALIGVTPIEGMLAILDYEKDAATAYQAWLKQPVTPKVLQQSTPITASRPHNVSSHIPSSIRRLSAPAGTPEHLQLDNLVAKVKTLDDLIYTPEPASTEPASPPEPIVAEFPAESTHTTPETITGNPNAQQTSTDDAPINPKGLVAKVATLDDLIYTPTTKPTASEALSADNELQQTLTAASVEELPTHSATTDHELVTTITGPAPLPELTATAMTSTTSTEPSPVETTFVAIADQTKPTLTAIETEASSLSIEIPRDLSPTTEDNSTLSAGLLADTEAPSDLAHIGPVESATLPVNDGAATVVSENQDSQPEMLRDTAQTSSALTPTVSAITTTESALADTSPLSEPPLANDEPVPTTISTKTIVAKPHVSKKVARLESTVDEQSEAQIAEHHSPVITPSSVELAHVESSSTTRPLLSNDLSDTSSPIAPVAAQEEVYGQSQRTKERRSYHTSTRAKATKSPAVNSATNQKTNTWLQKKKTVRRRSRLTRHTAGGFATATNQGKLPLVGVGIAPEVARVLKPTLDSLEIELATTTAGNRAVDFNDNDFNPGGGLGVVFMTGDFSLGGGGTVTWREGKYLLGFGHPFFAAGDVAYPMTPIDVITVVQALPWSYKMINFGPVVGAVVQDRATGVLGEIGRKVAMAPLAIEVYNERGKQASYQAEFFHHRKLTPLVLASAIGSSLYASLVEDVKQTARLKMDLQLARYGTIPFREVAGGKDGWATLVKTMHRFFALLYDNDFESAQLSDLQVRIDVEPGWKLSEVYGITNLSGQLQAGGTLDLSVLLQQYDNAEILRKKVTIPIPQGVGGENLTVFIGDAKAADAIDFGNKSAKQYASLADIVDALRARRDNQYLYVKLLQATKGVRVAGVNMSNVLPSVRELYRSPKNITLGCATDQTTLYETKIKVPGQFQGQQTFPINIEPAL